MPVMNNRVKKVVFYSTRQIQPYFSDREHLFRCDSMIWYFSKLDDKFSHWLSDLAFLTEYIHKLEENGKKFEHNDDNNIKKKLEEIRSIVYQSEVMDPHQTRVKDLAIFLNRQKKADVGDYFWDEAFKEYINLNKASILFEPKHYEDRKIQNQILSGKVTHLNRDLTEIRIEGGYSEAIDNSSRVKHRLGIYHKEEGEYAVAAVWPWPKGDTFEPNHDENWKKTIIEAINELYPNTDEMILVIHDWDLDEWKDKDQPVFRRRPLSRIKDSNYDEECLPNKDDPRISLIVFQHTNGNVVDLLKKDRGGHLNTPKQVWEAIDKYIESGYLLMKADKEDLITKIHSEAID